MADAEPTPRAADRTQTIERLRLRFAGVKNGGTVLEDILGAAVAFCSGEMAAYPGLCVLLPPVGEVRFGREEHPRAAWRGDLADFLKAANLPAMPQVGLELKRMLDNPNSTADELAQVVLKDQKLTAAVLKLVNSPMFMLPSKVDTVTRAITVVGRKHVSHLALGAILMTIFDASPKDAIQLGNFWRHSLAVALIARNVARVVGKKVPERYFVAGLLHDIGQLAILYRLPAAAQAIFALSSAEHLDHFQAEQELLGFTHAEVGEALLAGWHFPTHLVASIAFHHCPSHDLEQDVARIVHVADVLAQALGLATCPDFYVSSLNCEAFTALRLDRKTLDLALEGLGQQLDSVYSILAR